MPSNVEIKAKVADFPAFLMRAKEVSGTEGDVIHQMDTFFNCPNGRLKIRCLQECKRPGVLIFYRRPDKIGPKVSEFECVNLEKSDEVKNALGLAYGVKGEVRKTRTLFHVGQTKIHADKVESLGTFMELEVQMKDGQSVEEGHKIAEDLMTRLGVRKDDLITGAYMDHILQNQVESANE